MPITIAGLEVEPPTLEQATAIFAPTGQPIGYRPHTVHGPTCDKGCLAPGSSPHTHAVEITGWTLYGTNAIAEVDADGMCTRIAMIHTWPEGT